MGFRPTWETTWRFVAALAFCTVAAWFAFLRGVRVPLLGWADLGFHELGHLLASPLPRTVMFLAGSFTQVAVPVGLAVYFWAVRDDLVATSVTLAWAAASAQDVSVYVADAPYQRLPLIGGQHDWAFLLGPAGFGGMDQAAGLARAVWLFGLAVLLIAVAAAVVGLVRARRGRVAAPDPAVRIRPVRYR